MSNLPENLMYTKNHEWLRVEGNKGKIGITDYAKEALGDIVFVELPNLDDQLEAESSLGVVESVKAASDIYTPVSGKVIETNSSLMEAPEIINEDPYEKGWIAIVEISNLDEVKNLMTKEQYQEFLEENA